jgi:hypothetical protein
VTTSKKISPSKDKEYVKAYNSKRRAKKTQVLPAVLEEDAELDAIIHIPAKLRQVLPAVVEEDCSRILSSREKHALLKAKQTGLAGCSRKVEGLMEQIKSIIINNWKRVFSVVMMEHAKLFKLREENGVRFEGKIYERVQVRKYSPRHQKYALPLTYWSEEYTAKCDAENTGGYYRDIPHSLEECFRKTFVGLPEEILLSAIERLMGHKKKPYFRPTQIWYRDWCEIHKFVEENFIHFKVNPVIGFVKKLEKQLNYASARHSYWSVFNLKKCDTKGNCSAINTVKNDTYYNQGKRDNYTMTGLKVDCLINLTKEIGYKGEKKYKAMANWWLHIYAPLNDL